MSDEEYEAWIKPRMERMLTTSPSCLKAFATKRVSQISDLGVALDGHGEETNSAFLLICSSCAEQTFGVQAYRWTNPHLRADHPPVVLSPIRATCRSCGRDGQVIDTDVHGYNAAYAGGSATARGEGKPAELACESCGGRALQLAARFEYPGDLIECVHEDVDEEPNFVGHEQELFSWFTLVGTCGSCGKSQTLAEFETA